MSGKEKRAHGPASGKHLTTNPFGPSNKSKSAFTNNMLKKLTATPMYTKPQGGRRRKTRRHRRHRHRTRKH
jgi:hypothetical protein